jgi:putative aldouronate transport system permease protein
MESKYRDQLEYPLLRKRSLAKILKQYWVLYALFVPVIIFYIIFHYIPMVGIIIAFKNYNFIGGIWNSDWVGMKHFTRFLTNNEFWRVFRNTVTLAALRILITFPAPIILALLLNEVKNARYKKTLQTISYLPHFVSFVIVYAVFYNVLSFDGFLNSVREMLGMSKVLYLGSPKHYRLLFVVMALYKEVGWGAIIYLASLSRVSPELYESAQVDGAKKLRQIWHVTLPGIRPIISIQFVRTMGSILAVSFEQTLVMNNSMVSSVADVMSYYIYKVGLLSANQFSYATAIGLFDSAIALGIVIMMNYGAKKIDEDGGLW